MAPAFELRWSEVVGGITDKGRQVLQSQLLLGGRRGDEWRREMSSEEIKDIERRLRKLERERPMEFLRKQLDSLENQEKELITEADQKLQKIKEQKEMLMTELLKLQAEEEKEKWLASSQKKEEDRNYSLFLSVEQSRFMPSFTFMSVSLVVRAEN